MSFSGGYLLKNGVVGEPYTEKNGTQAESFLG